MARYVPTMVLVLAVLGSALAVVLLQHERRDRFVAWRQLQREGDQMAMDWDRLHLERSALTANDQVEQIARERLDMHVPAAASIVLVMP